jgi:hypothetical protein
MRLIALLVALIAFAGIARAEPLTDAQVTERGRALTEQFYKVDLDPVWAACSADLQTRLGGLEAFRNYRLSGVESFGQELKLYDEGVFDQDGLKFYVRAASFEKRPELVWYVAWGFNTESGVVEFFSIEFAGNAPK